MAFRVEDPYNLNTLQSRMEGLGCFFQHTLETPTTMRLAEDHAKAGGQMPAVFLTDHQTNGIGREGRIWLDKRGASILVSQVNAIKPNTGPTYVDLVALHICKVIKAFTGVNETQIKYPNDLVIDDQKVGGILIINIDQNGQYLATNTGVGINVHYFQQELIDYPTDYGATALDLHTPTTNRREDLVLALMGGLQFIPGDAYIFTANPQVRQDQNNSWREHSSVYGRVVQIDTEEGVKVRGRVVDTQVGRGILVEDAWGSNWFNQFDTKMKVRVA